MIGADTATGPFGRSLKQWLQKAIPARWASRFEFLDARPGQELLGEIRAATISCFPSLWENFPDVCLEAMSQGCPVVGSDAGGMAELIVPGVSGMTFRSGDASDLAAQLASLLDSRQLRERLGAAGRERVEAYCNPAGIAAQLETLVDAWTPEAPRPGRHAVAVDGSAPRVSILIPFYNLHAYLPETLASIEAQTCKDYEVIIVDDGSTEPASHQLLAELERNGHTIVRKANGGLSSARNAGLRVARVGGSFLSTRTTSSRPRSSRGRCWRWRGIQTSPTRPRWSRCSSPRPQRPPRSGSRGASSAMRSPSPTSPRPAPP